MHGCGERRKVGFWSAYLRASCVASLILVVALHAAGLADPELALVWDVAVLAPWIVCYVLLFTLGLGSVGLCVLRSLRWVRLPCYAGTGLVLGSLLPGLLFVATGEPNFAAACLLFGTAGAAAATAFWSARPPA